MTRPHPTRRRPLSVLRLEDRLAPVADLYAGVPLTAAIPAHAAEPLTGTPGVSLIYVSPTGLNPDGPTTGAEGTAANPRTLLDAVNWATDQTAKDQTLVLRGGTYHAAGATVDDRLSLVAAAGEQPWLAGSVPVTNWAADAATVPGRTFWRMGTDDFDPDGAGAAFGPRDFEFPQWRDEHYVRVQTDTVRDHPFANNGEAVWVGDAGGPLAPLKQVGLYRKLTGQYDRYTIDVNGTPTAVTYYYRRTRDFKLLDPAGVPAAEADGTPIPGGGTTPQDFLDATNVAANLALLADIPLAPLPAPGTDTRHAVGLGADKFFVDYVGHGLYTAADPGAAGRVIEATTVNTGLFVNGSGDDVLVRGLGFTRYARTGLQASGADRLRLEHNAAAWNGNSGLVLNGPDSVARGNHALANGEGGMNGGGDRLLAEGNTIEWSNVERHATNWNAAAWKITQVDDVVFRDNRFRNNAATALWLDINVRNAFVVNNVADNAGIGGGHLAYFSEISDGNTIAFNLAANCGTGVMISGASRNRVFNNTFVNCTTAVTVKDYDRTNDWNEDGGVVGGGGAFDGDPYEGGEDDQDAARGSVWDAYDNLILNNLFANTRGSRLFDAGGTQDPYNAGDPLVNGRATGRPYTSRTMIAAMDFNGYHVSDTADDLILWDPGLGGDVTYDTPAGFNTFRTTYGLEPNTPTAGAGQLVYVGGADPFLASVAGGDYRPRAGGPAVGRSTAAGTLAAVPADILRAAGRTQPTFLGALPPAGGDAAPPTVSTISRQTVGENGSTAALPFTVGDAVTPAGSLAVVVTSSHPELVPAANIVLGGSGAGRTVTVTPAADRAGTATITLAVLDAAGNRTTTSFLLTVTVANPRPGFTSGGSTSRSAPTLGVKDTPLSIPLVLTDAGGDVNTVTLSATSWGEEFVPNSPAHIALGGTGANRTLTLTPLPGTTGVLSVDVVATDAAGATATRHLFVDFRSPDGNRSPRIHTINNRGVPVGTTTGKIEYTVNDLEQPTGAGLTVTAASSDPLLVPAANIALGGEADSNPDSRWVQVTPAAGRSGVAVVTLTVRDRGANGVAGDADDAFGVRRFSVFVNSPPTGAALSADRVSEGQPAGTAVGTLLAQDPGAAGDSFAFELVPGAGATDNAQFQVVGNELRTAVPLDYAAGATRSVRVRVTDFLGATAEQVLTVRVAQVVTAAVTVNGGAAQRSMVARLAVAFNTLVALGADAFAVRPLGGGAAVPVTWAAADVGGRTVATITFPGGSAPDGRWRLVTSAAAVAPRAGGGGMAADHAADFHRLFGDGNGDATVNLGDLAGFAAAFGTSDGGPGYDPGFDGNADGTVNLGDLAEFAARFGASV